MGWWRRYVLSAFSPRTLGEEIIKKQEEIYEGQRRLFPGQDEHTYLTQVWLSRKAAYPHRMNPDDPEVQTWAATQTFQFACLEPPASIRALALYIVWKEHPDIIEGSPKYQEEFNRIIVPVFKAEREGTLDTLYAARNPKLAREAGVS